MMLLYLFRALSNFETSFSYTEHTLLVNRSQRAALVTRLCVPGKLKSRKDISLQNSTRNKGRGELVRLLVANHQTSSLLHPQESLLNRVLRPHSHHPPTSTHPSLLCPKQLLPVVVYFALKPSLKASRHPVNHLPVQAEAQVSLRLRTNHHIIPKHPGASINIVRNPVYLILLLLLGYWNLLPVHIPYVGEH